jgi:DNA-binding LytR/AlgR family response regulator
MKKMGDQISVHFEDGSSRSFRGNLKMFHKKFPNSKFKKVNKSVVVNMDKVVGMNKNRIKINEETHFEVSRSFKKPIKEIINQ